jgi:hypothetical protein
MLLGFVVSERGIDANLEKILAITNMAPIQNLKGVQKLMGCLASLSRFITPQRKGSAPVPPPQEI